jgi:hypothetical protein
MDPIRTYRERLIQVRRRFELYTDRVDIQAKWLLRGEFVSSVRLQALDPQFRSFYIRNKLFKPSMFMLVIGFSIVFLAGDVDRLRALAPVSVVGVVVTLVGIAMSWLTSRRIRFVQFPARGGDAGLDIGCAGPDRKAFDSFVSEVQRRIRKAGKRNTQGDRPAAQGS